MIRRLATTLLAGLLAALLLVLVPTVALAQSGTVLAADSEDREYSEDGDHSGDEDHGEEGDHEVELQNMDNGDPGDAGAQALAGAEGPGFITIMMIVAGGIVLVLLVGGLAMGRGRNA